MDLLQPLDRPQGDRTTHIVTTVQGDLSLWIALAALPALTPVEVTFTMGSRGKARLKSVVPVA